MDCCELCEGQLGVMGQLGDREHLLCRDCGMWFSRPAEDNRPQEEDEQ